ncbi:LysR family transcriptional regulator [Phenylobacterium deserti]|uniref:LysR family transcriptional regulator n=1 Tax=Phenylobacterium deserti TaxID=1914756 RepID=A0A328ASU6_9CAUL|nr:LysR family transcriptional regulator [Phenylobacterium deserti]RAK58070.1 LysR family transcriptional regulator [Phenylobacterium deserti]
MLPDLNLLRVFDVLLEERSVTRAGARLGLTQSAVSHALNRLRYSLGDELFVRGPNGMQPTPRALEMGAQVHAALNQLQAAVSPQDFDPSTTERRFVLVAGAYSATVLGPEIASRMAQIAPRAEVVLQELLPDVLDRLDTRRVDFILGGVVAAPDRFAREPVLEETLCWVVRADHPLAALPEVSLEALVSYPHVTISRQLPGLGPDERPDLVTKASWIDGGAFEAALNAAGLTRQVGVTAPDTYSALSIASRTLLVAIAPRRLAQLAAETGRVKLIEPPYPSQPVPVNLVFLRDRAVEPAIAWMRELIRQAGAAI